MYVSKSTLFVTSVALLMLMKYSFAKRDFFVYTQQKREDFHHESLSQDFLST